MSGTPIDLSAFKPVAGQPLAAAPISNGFTAIEAWSGANIDPAALKQNAATIGQGLVWNGTNWGPGAPVGISPTLLGPTSWPSGSTALNANEVRMTPVAVIVPTTITRLGFGIAAGTGTGNVDIGVYYSDDDLTLTRLVSKGSTATPGSNGAQTFTIAATTLTPVTGRRWYLALACSSATPTFHYNSFSLVPTNFLKASSFPLPATITGASAAGGNLSLYGLV